MCHGNLKLKLLDGSPKYIIYLYVYLHKTFVKIGGNEKNA